MTGIRSAGGAPCGAPRLATGLASHALPREGERTCEFRQLAKRVACSRGARSCRRRRSTVLHVLHRRHHRRDRDAARPWRCRRRARAVARRHARRRRVARARGVACAAPRDLRDARWPTPVPRRVPVLRRARDALARRQTEATSVSDQVVVTSFPAPHSYTGDDVVEISAHGSPVVLQAILARDRRRRAARRAGRVHAARVSQRQARSGAGRGRRRSDRRGHAAAGARGVRSARGHADRRRLRDIEATLFDLMARLEASLDFPGRGLSLRRRPAAAARSRRCRDAIDALLASAARGRLVREGAQVAIVGTPNVGKSSLFNALLNANRAIVTPIPGTTRDLLTERADIGGIVDRARRHGGHPRDDGRRRAGRRRARAPARLRWPIWRWWCSIDRDRSTTRRSRCSRRPRVAAAAWS